MNMKNFTQLIRFFLTSIILLGFYGISNGQLLLDENFNYPAGDLLTAHGWSAHSGGGTQPITVNDGGLTFPGYIDSGIGNAALVDNNGEDDNKTYTVQTAGTVYVAFMINVSSTAAGYFFHLGGDPIGTSIFRGKVFMDATNHFGASNGSNTATYASAAYTLGTTYLLVLKYEIVAGTNNDIVSLFIFDSGTPATEPAVPTIGPLTDASQSDINPGSVALRQFSTSENFLIDGIRVGMSWAVVLPPLATPTITIAPTSLTGFQYALGSGPSASQSYSLSGSNLSPAAGNITITPSVNYQVSLDNTTFSSVAITKSYSGGALSSTPVYVRLKAGLALGNYNLENIGNSGGGATAVNVSCSGTVVKAEPTNHTTGFAAVVGTPSYSSINTSWTDATGATLPDGYLVKGATGGYASIVDPVDGTPETDALLVKNIATGIQAGAFTGLTDNTTFYFKIFPYTNSGSFINYKTNGTVPTAMATTTLSPSLSYTWIGADGAAWNVPANWSPTRTTPYVNDILLFSGGGNKTITAVPTETIGKIAMSGNTTINLQSPAAAVITITGEIGADLDIPAGCALNLNAANAITIALATTATASISGSMTFSSTVNTAHKLTAVDPNAITFNNGGSFTSGIFMSGNPFGTGTANSVIFTSGSTFNHQSGSNPFVNNPPNSICVFQTGSLYKLIGSATPSFSGKTYANFEMDVTGTTVTTTGASAVTMDNLTITNGTLNFNVTATPGHSIKGNISVATGGTLNFNPSSAGTVTLNGSATQSISGAGVLTTGTNSTLEISNIAGITLGLSVAMNGNLKLTSGLLTLGSNNLILGTTSIVSGTPSATNMIVATGSGQLQKGFASGFTGSFIYPVGDNTGTAEYSPVTLNFTAGTFGTGNFAGVNLVNAKYPPDPNTGNYLKRYWAISQTGITGYICNATFQYLTADVNGTESQIYCLKVLPLPFLTYSPANTTLHQLSANGLNSFGTFTGSQPQLANVTTTSPVINITYNSATAGGNVTADGGSTITARGVCYATTHNPTLTDPHTTEPGALGVFTSNISGLNPQTTYYVRAYATNMVGTSYGSEVTFTTLCEPYAPVVDFSADHISIMVGDSINFFDASIYCPTSWTWSFVGGIPYQSVIKNPTWIHYNYPGVYNVCLTATNSYGPGSLCKEAYITVTAPPTPTNAKLVITEIMYNPPESGIDTLEFIEMYNNDSLALNVKDFYFSYGVVYTFPDTTMLPYSYLIVAKSDTAMLNAFGVHVLEWTYGNLNNGGEPLVIYDREGFLVDSVAYDDAPPWDTLADGWGPSLELCDPSSDNNNPLNWRAAIEFAAINAAGDTLWASPMAGCSYPPLADFVASDTAIAQYQFVTFTDSSSANTEAWFWTFEGGIPDVYIGKAPPPVQYNTMGAFDVTLKVVNLAGQNTLIKSEYIEVGPSGIPGLDGKDGIKIYPNPNQGQFTLLLKNKENAQVRIIDHLGKIVYFAEVTQQTNKISLPGLVPGIYILRVAENKTGQTKSIKLIIQ